MKQIQTGRQRKVDMNRQTNTHLIILAERHTNTHLVTLADIHRHKHIITLVKRHKHKLLTPVDKTHKHIRNNTIIHLSQDQQKQKILVLR